MSSRTGFRGVTQRELAACGVLGATLVEDLWLVIHFTNRDEVWCRAEHGTMVFDDTRFGYVETRYAHGKDAAHVHVH
jgi:hypothetical protein